MSELSVIRGYYERVVAADFPGAGEIAEDEPRINAVKVRGCHGNTQNLLFFSVEVEDGHVRGLKYECQYCDPTMYVTAEVVRELVEGKPVGEIEAIGDAELTEALGGESRKVIREARMALELLAEAINEITRGD